MRWVTAFGQVNHLANLSSAPRPLLSLAVPQWISAISTGNCYGRSEEENGELRVAVGRLTNTAGILTGLAKSAIAVKF